MVRIIKAISFRKKVLDKVNKLRGNQSLSGFINDFFAKILNLEIKKKVKEGAKL